MSDTYDIIIIGGGINGCTTAFELAQRGIRVAVVEKDNIGDGPTGRSSACIRQHYSNELTARMALYGLDVFSNFAERVGGECGFKQTGFVALVAAEDLAGLEANVKMQRSVGIHSEILSTESVREIFPGLQTADIIAAAWEAEAGYADAYLTVNSYAAAARRAGAKIFTNTAVTGITQTGGRVTGVETTAGSMSAPVVVNCAGAWGARVARMAGVEVPVEACRVQISLFKRPPGEEKIHPVVIDFLNAVYWRDKTGGLTLVGSVDPAEANDTVNPDQYNEGVDTEFILDSGERLIQRYPAMERSDSAGGYSALYDVSPDWHAIVDESAPGSGFFMCLGSSGHGFKLGPAMGRLVADRVLGVSEPLFDAHIFRLGRFAEGDLVTGNYEYSIAG
ncbi:MAG: FAD-binding oxidoreductase [Anaerolineae bacterium]|nr:FAD-binding oxidoreductase [Anaerolineae bacterium]